VTESEQKELAEILAEMGYDRASRTWKSSPVSMTDEEFKALNVEIVEIARKHTRDKPPRDGGVV
jgi:hypothetical protein